MTLAAGADSQTWTFPSVSDTVAALGTLQTFTKQNAFTVASTIASSSGASLDDIKVTAATTTITGTTLITQLNKVALYKPTFTDAGSVTVTDGATLYIEGAPADSGLARVTFTNAWAILVPSTGGNVKFAGTGNVLGTITSGVWNGTSIDLAHGGTNANLTASNGGIFYSTASAAAVLAGTATAGQMLRSGATAAPTWSTATWPATTTINRLLYSSAANVVSDLATANSSILVTSVTGVPSLSTTLPAFTLGGAVSGGTNTVDNVVIGSITPLAGTFTTLTGSSIISSGTVQAAAASGYKLGSTVALSVSSGLNVLWDPTGAAVVVQSNSSDAWLQGTSVFLRDRGGSTTYAKFASALTLGYVCSDGSAVITSGTTCTTSDDDLKIVDGKVANSDDLLKLNAYRFRWKNPAQGTGEQIGLLASEVEAVFPQVVGSLGGYKTVDYQKLIAPAVVILSRHEAQLAQLIAANDNLRQEIDDLRRAIRR